MQSDIPPRDWLTTGIAIFGAVLALLLAVFEFYKWKTSGKAKLRITAYSNFGSTDVRDPTEYFSVTVTNIGDRPTTLNCIAFRYFESKPIFYRFSKCKRGTFGELFNLLLTNNLPAKLDIGESWNRLIIMTEETKEMARKGYLFIEAEDSVTIKASKFARTRLVVKD